MRPTLGLGFERFRLGSLIVLPLFCVCSVFVVFLFLWNIF